MTLVFCPRKNKRIKRGTIVSQETLGKQLFTATNVPPTSPPKKKKKIKALLTHSNFKKRKEKKPEVYFIKQRVASILNVPASTYHCGIQKEKSYL